jgi:multidrug efflux system membrane fusion protein
MLIPDGAVGNNQSVQFVYVVDAENKVKQRPVELGPMAEDLRIVRSGLTLDDRIIVSGIQRVRPDATVQPEEEPLDKAVKDGAGEGDVATSPEAKDANKSGQ